MKLKRLNETEERSDVHSPGDSMIHQYHRCSPVRIFHLWLASFHPCVYLGCRWKVHVLQMSSFYWNLDGPCRPYISSMNAIGLATNGHVRHY